MSRWIARTAEGVLQRNMPLVAGAATALAMVGVAFGERVSQSSSWRHLVVKHMASHKHLSGRAAAATNKAASQQQHGVETARGAALRAGNCAEGMDRTRLATMSRGLGKNAEEQIGLESRLG